MKTCIAAAVTALIVGVAAPVTSATARPDAAREFPTTVPLGVHDGPLYEAPSRTCAPSAAAEGNASQQTRPVKQYGQTTGGNRC